MAKYEVTLMHTVVKALSYVVSAKDEDAAREKVESMLEGCRSNPDMIAKKVKGEWDCDQDDIDMEIIDTD